MNVVEDAYEVRRVLGTQLIDVAGKHLMEAPVRPLLIANKAWIRM
jgi:hypothetical protein